MLKLLGLNKQKNTKSAPKFPAITLPVSPQSFYSMARLSTWAGSCCRVVRASDSAELDIGFINNKIDMASANAFKGASTLTVKIWYDQSGNGYDLIQNTAANMPALGSAPITGGMQSISINGARTSPVARKFLTNATVPVVENSYEVLMCALPTYSTRGGYFDVHPQASAQVAMATSGYINNPGIWVINNAVPKIFTGASRLVLPTVPTVIGHSGFTNEVGGYVDGNRKTFTGAGANTRTGFDLGAFTPAAVSHDADGRFDIFSYALFSARLSTGDRALVKDELNRTGGVISGQVNKVVWLGDSRTEG